MESPRKPRVCVCVCVSVSQGTAEQVLVKLLFKKAEPLAQLRRM